jgi:hypothetical protein
VGGRTRGLLEHILIHSRDKRVEELEKRLKWMEEQLKRVVKDQQSETDVESKNEPMGLEMPSCDGSQAGTYSVQNMHEDDSFDSGYRMAEVSPQGSDFGAPSENSRFYFISDFLELMISSVLLTRQPNSFLTLESNFR